ncbi:dihydrofolate reductase [Patescibacteria group bacterium]|nr:dihydrofolate reductase [Patescibacteria group bacterium]
MKVTIYMAVTANGMIARETGETPFTSKADYRAFRAQCRKTKAVIVGRRTFEIIRNDAEFFWQDCRYWIVTRHASDIAAPLPPNVTVSSDTPERIVRSVGRAGFNSITIMGGAGTNTSFLAAGVVTDIILDIEPFVYLRGIPLFHPELPLEVPLRLLEVKRLSPQTIQLHYYVTHGNSSKRQYHSREYKKI